MRAFPRARSPRGRHLALSLLAVAASSGLAAARSSGSPPEGLEVGKTVLRPFAWTAFQLDDNVFRSSTPSEDQINMFGLGARLLIPIRNSMIELGGEAIKRQYDLTTFTRDTDISVDADVLLHFSSFDTLTLRNNYYYGFSDVSRRDNDSGDVVFDGLPFEQFRTGVEVLRSVANEKGYYFRASRNTLRYDQEAAAQNAAFANYDGYDVGGEYRHPFSSHKWLVVYAGFRSFDHTSTQTDELEREERSSTYQLGLRGMLGKGQPFVLRMGYGTFDYEFPTSTTPASSFAGITATAEWSLKVGGRTGVDIQLDRRALPSNFDTSYVNTRVATTFSRPIRRNAYLGVDMRFDNNVFNDPVNCQQGGVVGLADRQDKRLGATASVNWFITNRLSYRMGVAFETRDSTCEQFQYDSTVLTLGVSTGWF